MKILNYGCMNIDHFYRVDHMATPGETIMALAQNIYCGGKGLNQSIAIARAGGDVCHAGVVGEDGEMLLEALASNGVDISRIRRASGPSSHTVIQVDANGQNSIIVFAGENMQSSEEELETFLQGFAPGDAVVLQNELSSSPMMMQKAAQNGLSVVFNPSPVNETLKQYPLECVSWLILNELEGKALTGEKEPERILNVLEERYPSASVVLTLGEEGAVCLHEGQRIYQKAFRVETVDTTAAGDTFTGYFLAGLAEKRSIAECMERACKAASIAVGRRGAADSIPTPDELC